MAIGRSKRPPIRRAALVGHMTLTQNPLAQLQTDAEGRPCLIAHSLLHIKLGTGK